MNYSLLNKAKELAIAAHNSINQRRKYTQELYWTHVVDVANILHAAGITDENVLVAAFLHDLAEDVMPQNSEYSFWRIEVEYGYAVSKLVGELTNHYTKEAYPKLSRAKRKVLERERIGKISNNAKLIKLADIISNTRSLAKDDPKFSVLYFSEQRDLLIHSLTNVNNELWDKAWEQTHLGKRKARELEEKG